MRAVKVASTKSGSKWQGQRLMAWLIPDVRQRNPMKMSHYDVPEEAPVHVRNWLKHCRSRAQLWTLVVLSILTALATAYAERGRVTALFSLVFLLGAIGPFLAVRWGERHNFFDGSSNAKDRL